LLLLLVSVATPALAQQRGRGYRKPRPVAELLGEIRSRRDKVPDQTLYELALHRSTDSLDAMKKAVRMLKDPQKLRIAYSSCEADRYSKGPIEAALPTVQP